jgi:hypothetical protein
MSSTLATDVTLDAVFFAQNHVLQPGAPYFKLVGNKNTLIKAHLLSQNEIESPKVEAILSLDGASYRLELKGPNSLPKEICIAPGKVVHRFEDSFTATIPGEWVKRGLQVVIKAGDLEEKVENIEIGPPLKMNMTMFDIHYFDYEDVDFPDGFDEEIFVRRPLTELNIQRLKRVLFSELIIPPRENLPCVRVRNEDEHMSKTGQPFNGKQLAAQQWYAALQNAGGQKKLNAYFISIANVHSGGWAWDYAGMGSLRRFPILNHEMGHVLGVDDLPCEAGYPYIGEMYGIDKGKGGFHGGPTWRFDPRTGFVSPTLSDKTDTPGEWKKDPMGGGGRGEEPGEDIAPFSDYSIRKMQDYMERNIVQWNEEKEEYCLWNHWTGSFSNVVRSNGVNFPIKNNVEVYSILFSVSAVTEEGNFIYPIIGPYKSGLVDTFDPNTEDDRKRARRVGVGPWDISLQIEQGGKTKTFMVPLAWNPRGNPLDLDTFLTHAVNVPVSDGIISKARILLTPDATVEGIPSKPRALFSVENPTVEPSNPTGIFHYQQKAH